MKGNTPIEAHHCTKKIFLVFTLMFFSIFLVGTVSAFEFDNKLTYSNDDLKINLINWFGFGVDYGSAELKSHSSVTEIRPVKLGNSTIMWYEFDFLELYENGLGDVEIINVKTGEIIERDYQFVYWGNETYKVPNYICENILGENGTIGKECFKFGTKNNTREAWLSYNSRDIPKGEITIGLKLNMFMDETLDVIWRVGGKKIEKHAVVSSGAVETTDGDFTILTYNNNGTFNVSGETLENVTVLIIAGGGPGGGNLNNMGGGGGAGGLVFGENLNITVGNYDIFVGLGGLGLNGSFRGEQGQNSSAFGIVGIGGGPGGAGATGDVNGEDGGSGGGDGWAGSPGLSIQGNFSNATGFGSDGGTTTGNPVGGGGGANETGGSGNSTGGNNGGQGGDGRRYSINGTLVCYAGGGGGGADAVEGEANCGGGNGGNPTGSGGPGTGEDGIDGTGGGGGGGSFAGGNVKGGDGGDGVVIIRFSSRFVPIVNLNSPEDFFNTTNPSITFNATIFEEIPDNVTLFIDDVGNETNTTGILDNYIFNKIISEGTHTWNVQACNNDGCGNGTQRTFTIDFSSPIINITFPTETINFHIINTNLSVNWTVSDLNLDTCILQFEGINRTVTCLDNQTQINITNIENRTIIFFANDTFGNVNSSTRSWNYLSLQNLLTFNASTFETASETFTINITTNGTTPTSASLVYNGTGFIEATVTSLGGDDFNISKTIDIPLINGNTPFHFNFSIASTEITTEDTNQSVNLTTFEFCETGQQPAYINFTFTNETVAEEAITAEIDTTWNFWLGSGTVIDSLTFSNITENLNYQFCLTSGGNRTLNANVSLTYNNALSQLRRFTQEFTLTNTTTTQNLFLLPTADGIFVTFQVVDPAEQVISGVSANVTKDGNLISNGVTDDAGLITYFLDPDTTYIFSFSKTGLTTVTTTLVPTQTSFTIIMGIVTTISQFDTTRGINYIINPIDLTLINNTLVNFNLTFSSSFHSLEQFGFVLKNSTGTLFNVTTSTIETGGFLSQILDTGSNTDIIMEVFWTITGNQTNVTRIWLVFNLENEGFSILTFFNDLTRFTDSDLFGLDNFGLGIIVFLIILVSTGIVSVKFGLTSPPGISIIVFSLVAFFDVALGIIPNPINAIPNFPTIFVGLIFLGTLYSEAIK